MTIENMKNKRWFSNFQPYEFEWRVAKDGYQWVEGTTHASSRPAPSKPRLFLTEQIISGAFLERRYKPLETETGLFRRFADINPNGEEILKFAGAFGRLGGTAAELIDVRKGKVSAPLVELLSVEEDQGKVGSLTSGESLQAWQDAIFDMKRAVEILDAVQRSDSRFLAQFIKWRSPDLVVYQRSIGGRLRDSTIAFRELDPERMSRFRYRDVLLPAQFWLQSFVNKHIEENPSYVRMLWDEMRHPSLFVCPEGLLAALWLQVGFAIDGDRKYRRCLACPRWFEVGQGKRSDSKTCSDTCRKRFSRPGGNAKKKGK